MSLQTRLVAIVIIIFVLRILGNEREAWCALSATVPAPANQMPVAGQLFKGLLGVGISLAELADGKPQAGSRLTGLCRRCRRSGQCFQFQVPAAAALAFWRSPMAHGPHWSKGNKGPPLEQGKLSMAFLKFLIQTATLTPDTCKKLSKRVRKVIAACHLLVGRYASQTVWTAVLWIACA